MCVVQEMIQKMFGFLPNGETVNTLQATAVSEASEPVYDTPQRVHRPVVIADSQPMSPVSPPPVITTPSVQPSTRPTPVARVRSSKKTYVYAFIFIVITLAGRQPV